MQPPADLYGLTVGQIGHFDPAYPRNALMARALRAAGATVEVITDGRSFARRTPALVRRASGHRFDLLLVGFPGHIDVALARALALPRRIPVVSDTFVSMYETNVEDRAVTSPHGLGAWRCRAEDWLSCRLADVVVLDTQTHIDWFAERYRIPAGKFRRVWVGADEDVFHPRLRPARNQAFTVLFVGTYIPLHGLEHVVDAAHFLDQDGRSTRFLIVGRGQEQAAVHARAKALGVRNIEFRDRVNPETMATMIAESDLCLGIFGTSPKTQRVIPNKVFAALAMARPVVTADTPAAREVLVHKTHAWLCPPGDGRALADAIATLEDDATTTQAIADGGHALFTERFSLAAMTADVSRIVADLVAR